MINIPVNGRENNAFNDGLSWLSCVSSIRFSYCHFVFPEQASAFCSTRKCQGKVHSRQGPEKGPKCDLLVASSLCSQFLLNIRCFNPPISLMGWTQRRKQKAENSQGIHTSSQSRRVWHCALLWPWLPQFSPSPLWLFHRPCTAPKGCRQCSFSNRTPQSTQRGVLLSPLSQDQWDG